MTPHLSLAFNGTCEAAFRFYERSMGAAIDGLFTWGNSPMAADAPPGWADKVMHGWIKIGGMRIAGADVLPSQYERLQGFSILLNLSDPAEAERIFDALAEDGTVVMPLTETFWAVRFGEVVDQFGVPWAINCEAPPEAAAG